MLTPKQLKTLRASDGSPNRVWAAMRLAGVTQVELAEAVGMAQPVISSVANGKYSRLPYSTVVKLATFFGCAAEDLFPAREAVAS